MNKQIAILTVKYVTCVASGVTLATVFLPTVKKAFGLDKKKEPKLIPCEDIEEEETEEEQ